MTRRNKRAGLSEHRERGRRVIAAWTLVATSISGCMGSRSASEGDAGSAGAARGGARGASGGHAGTGGSSRSQGGASAGSAGYAGLAIGGEAGASTGGNAGSASGGASPSGGSSTGGAAGAPAGGSSSGGGATCGGCAPGFKVVTPVAPVQFLACVSVDDPVAGCADPNNTPCTPLHATARCVGGACAGDVCRPGFADCNQNPFDGCETNLSSPSTCGACGQNCGGKLCEAGACVSVCSPGMTRCGSSCVDLMTDPSNCGACGQTYPQAAVFPTCTGGVLDFECRPGFERCRDQACVIAHTCDSLLITSASGMALGAQCDSGFVPVSQTITTGGLPTVFGSGTAAGPVTLARCVDPMRDVHHCGVAQVNCGTGWCDQGACASLSSIELAAGLAGPTNLQLSGGKLYFSDGGWIYELATTGGSPRPIAAASSIRKMRVDTAYAYWVASGSDVIQRTALADGTTTTIVQASHLVQDFDIDDDAVYWIENVQSGVITTDQLLRRVAKSDGTITDLEHRTTPNAADQSAVWIHADAFWVYWIIRGGFGAGSDHDTLEVIDKTSGIVRNLQAMLDDNYPTYFVGPPSPAGDPSVYLQYEDSFDTGDTLGVGYAGSFAWSAGGMLYRFYYGERARVSPVAADARSVFLLREGYAELPTCGGSEVTLVADGTPLGIAVDDAVVYVAFSNPSTSGGGWIGRVPRRVPSN